MFVCTNKKNVNIKFNAHCVSGITLNRYGQTQNMAIVLSVLLRFTDFDYPYGIFKFFLMRM
jgi:hypothetical protein